MIKKLFAPGKDSTATSIGLLALRLFFGLTMLLHHGLDKLEHFSQMAPHWADPLGIGHKASLGLTVFSEVVAAILLAFGLLTRFAALVLAIEMAVAFVTIHKLTLGGAVPGEFAFVYFGAYLTLLFAGGGKFSMDKPLFGKGGSSKGGFSQPK
ncbi:MAG: DoxX family protein [Limisphaerales bacterium]